MPLPVTFQFFIAMVAYAINERTTHKLNYVQEEIRVLREALRTATGKSGIGFTAGQRRRLAIKGRGPHPARTPRASDSLCAACDNPEVVSRACCETVQRLQGSNPRQAS